MPALDLVIVFFGSNYNQPIQHETKYGSVPDFILRSVVEGSREGHRGLVEDVRKKGSVSE